MAMPRPRTSPVKGSVLGARLAGAAPAVAAALVLVGGSALPLRLEDLGDRPLLRIHHQGVQHAVSIEEDEWLRLVHSENPAFLASPWNIRTVSSENSARLFPRSACTLEMRSSVAVMTWQPQASAW